MSNQPFHDDEAVTRTTTVRASRGGAGKWLLGGLAVAVVAGAGYFAWKNYTPSQPETQTASIDQYGGQYAGEPVHAAPLEQAAPDESAAPADDAISTAPARAAAPRRAITAHVAPTVAEATIGVTPASASADAQSATEEEGVIVNAPRLPVWTRMPNARRLAALYPVVAEEQGREGEAQLRCTVQHNGALDCVRVSETRGFGNAALRIAHTLRHAPQFADGSDAVGAPVNLRVVFRLPPEDRRG